MDQNVTPISSVNLEEILYSINEYVDKPKFSVYHLIKLHVESRGEIVTNKEDADLILDFEKFTNNYIETLKYMGV